MEITLLRELEREVCLLIEHDTMVYDVYALERCVCKQATVYYYHYPKRRLGNCALGGNLVLYYSMLCGICIASDSDFFLLCVLGWNGEGG
jgi:hypothetical protein